MSAPLRFLVSPPGLEPFVDFLLVEIEGAPGLYTVTAAAEGGPRLFVLDAAVHLPSYQPTITDQQCELLALQKPEDASVLVVVNPAANEKTTVNLMAPIVVNMTTGGCAQLILEGQDWPIKAELANAA
ncbi:flagellar assembly factor FliW [Okibacterium sp. HSC-33S16]|uniref:flagellar assembly protein FliW n=1 Tax=Microbacteriaceae TaxID=85023 RepID=UPI0020A11013|nr:flagellar assembly protein FliW [Okibacterium sp. HSC-33S16]MCP2032947.1 flagellar assembly factor FliW [Okibacterium sp. HSC-33S16]